MRQYGMPLMPSVNPPRIDEREACPIWHFTMAEYLELFWGYDISQFDYEYLSQMSVEQWFCNDFTNPNFAAQPGDTWYVNFQGTGMTWPVTSPVWASWRYVMIEFIEYLLSIQTPYPVSDLVLIGNVGTGINDLNADGYIDQFDLDHYICFSCQ